jgi:hypothetical protein
MRGARLIFDFNSSGRAQTILISSFTQKILEVMGLPDAVMGRSYGYMPATVISHRRSRDAIGELGALCDLLLECQTERIRAGCCRSSYAVEDYFDGLPTGGRKLQWPSRFKEIIGEEQRTHIINIKDDDCKDSVKRVVKSVHDGNKKYRGEGIDGIELANILVQAMARSGVMVEEIGDSSKWVSSHRAADYRSRYMRVVGCGNEKTLLRFSVWRPTENNKSVIVLVNSKFGHCKRMCIKTGLQTAENSIKLAVTVLIPPHIMDTIDARYVQEILPVFDEFVRSDAFAILSGAVDRRR